MPTNDERREVAARLRNYENLRESFRESPICSLLDALGVGYIDWKGVCSRLADLIEPDPERTCRMELNWDYDGDCPAYYRDYVCSECKEDFIYYKNSRVSYCPNCGARVVEVE